MMSRDVLVQMVINTSKVEQYITLNLLTNIEIDFFDL